MTFWLTDAALDAYVFEETHTYIESLLAPEPVELWMRFLVFVIVVAFSLFAARLYSRQDKAIAELQRTQAALQGSEARVAKEQRQAQELIEVLPNPVYFKGLDGRYLGVNRAWETYFGRPRQDFLGKTVNELYADHPEIAQRLRADDQVLWDNPSGHSYETTIIAADGRLRNAIYYKAAFTGVDGRVAGLIGTIRGGPVC